MYYVELWYNGDYADQVRWKVICMYLGYWFFLCFYDFAIRFWNCSDSVVIFVSHFTVWYYMRIVPRPGYFGVLTATIWKLLEIILNIFRYFKYLLKSEDVLLSEALKVSKSLKSLNINSWYDSIESLMQYINIRDDNKVKKVKKVKNMKIDLKSLNYSKLRQKI